MIAISNGMSIYTVFVQLLQRVERGWGGRNQGRRLLLQSNDMRDALKLLVLPLAFNVRLALLALLLPSGNGFLASRWLQEQSFCNQPTKQPDAKSLMSLLRTETRRWC
jgi:hypothetical protein